MDDKTKNKLTTQLKNHKLTMNDISDLLNVEPEEAQKFISELQNEGVDIDIQQQRKGRKLIYHINVLPDTGNVYFISGPDSTERDMVFGSCSDLHFASTYHLPKTFHDAMIKLEDKGVTKVYVAGDIHDGYGIYRGHLENLITHSIEGQTDIAAEALSKHPNLEFFGVAGNHDFSYTKQSGAKPLAILEQKVDNFTNLGDLRADVIYRGIKIRLLHGGSGRTYARCFDEETEILTDKGWKFFRDLDRTEQVATLNLETDKFEWQLPTHWTNEKFNGNLIHFKNRCTDLLVTPNHRMLIRHTPSKTNHKEKLSMPQKSHKIRDIINWRIKEASKLKEEHSRQKYQMRRGGQSWDGKDEDELYAELVAWYVTEGCIDNGKTVNISQYKEVNPKSWQQIKNLIIKLGFKPGEYSKWLRIYNKELAQKLIKECGVGSYHKRIPKYLKEASTKILKIIFDTCIKGDGWQEGKLLGYKSFSNQLLDDVAEISHKLGYAVTYNYNTHSISISQEQIYPSITNKPKEIEYEGNIYCVSVPNGVILVRRNGRAIWSGNSYPSQTYLRDLFGGSERNSIKDMPHFILLGHYHTLYVGKDHGIWIVQSGSFQDGDNEYCLRRGLTGPAGAFVVEANYKSAKINEVKFTYVQPVVQQREKGKAFSKTTVNY